MWDFTCYTPRECSVVDYFISSEYLINYYFRHVRYQQFAMFSGHDVNYVSDLLLLCFNVIFVNHYINVYTSKLTS